MESLHNVFSGSYIFVPAYSPDLKPIELGFSNVKAWLRQNEAAAVSNPIEYINGAFELHSVRGERSDAGIILAFLIEYISYFN